MIVAALLIAALLSVSAINIIAGYFAALQNHGRALLICCYVHTVCVLAILYVTEHWPNG